MLATCEVLVIDPATRTTRAFGSFPIAREKWAGGVLAADGLIYGVPSAANSVPARVSGVGFG